jgi:hypothetical protein
MNKYRALILLLTVTSLTLSCGSGSDPSRQLQSITITQAANGQRIEFVATGHFSSPPATVTPIPAEWAVQLMAPPPSQYTLTPQPFEFECAVAEQTSPGPIPIVAYAPSNANAPLSGSWSGMVQASTVISCP